MMDGRSPLSPATMTVTSSPPPRFIASPTRAPQTASSRPAVRTKPRGGRDIALENGQTAATRWQSRPMTTSLLEPAHPLPQRAMARAASTACQRVLVVEDDPDARLMYSECLTGLGYLVATEVSGEQGVEAALRAPPDAILMDLEMPGIGGIEATRCLKSDPRTRDCLVIVVTGHGSSMFAEARRAGCDAYFCKPFDAVALDEVLRVLTTLRRPVRSATTAIVKQCGCGREYSRDEWGALRLCGRIHVPGRNFALELRNCVCGSSIAVQSEELPDDDAV
jgi:CheY-like chemotaxis protein